MERKGCVSHSETVTESEGRKQAVNFDNSLV
jgi:hypothetical protein